MAHVVVLGAGLGGTIMAYELRDNLSQGDRISIINKGSKYSFVPSNPWVAVGWRDRASIEVDLEPACKKRDIGLYPQGAKRLHAADNRIELTDGTFVDYDYLVIATGPELAFDEIPGFGPEANTQSVCHIDHALSAKGAFDKLVAKPGPVVIGAVQGASCYGPAYEFAFILEKALRDAKVRTGAGLRPQPMTIWPRRAGDTRPLEARCAPGASSDLQFQGPELGNKGFQRSTRTARPRPSTRLHPPIR
jgi:sulfide:quinone oxidoreductase